MRLDFYLWEDEMNVYIYSEWQNLIEKSGVGRALHHQKYAALHNQIHLVNDWRDADIVHINTVFAGSPVLAQKARHKHIPVVFHAHSTKEDFRNSFIGSNQLDRLFGKWIMYCYNQGDVIITPSQYSKLLLRSYGIKKPIAVLSNGIDTGFFAREKVDPSWFRKKYGYGQDTKIIMGVGLPIARKGILDFIELAGRMPQYQFIWFGDINRNMLPAKIRRKIQSAMPNVRFAGYVDPAELRQAYGSCDLFLFPSYEETEGIVVLEALSMKIPVMVRDIPVYLDWLQDGKNVYKAKNLEEFQVKAGQILERELPELTDAGYQVAKDRDLKAIGKQLQNIYRKCLENV